MKGVLAFVLPVLGHEPVQPEACINAHGLRRERCCFMPWIVADFGSGDRIGMCIGLRPIGR